ncbi:uracil-DNA glycosylase family protein [Pedobacter sp. ASV1-7]|uniref:uracil-DNA glycosylase family protein n=1 Tax=Pedobacter sp. ASV1-7 TaxID=3145237 RepID=UPI0032E931F1
MDNLIANIRQCKVCEPYLELGANPIISASKKSKIVIIGQAPGRIVHQTGIPWNDKSGDSLRNWLGVDKAMFYNEDIFALVPMGFCFPGKGKSGDLPPRKECAPLWHNKLLDFMQEVKLILLIGQYAQHYYLQDRCKTTLTETVKSYREYLPQYLPLPHPSPRNNIWMSKNKWFQTDVLTILKDQIKAVVED